FGWFWYVYMKVSGNSLELPDQLSLFVASPPRGGGEMGVYMKVPGDSLESPDATFIVCDPIPEGRGEKSFEPPDKLHFLLRHSPVNVDEDY
ncbi:MAG: hypothetical protein D3910_01245, partial [Candidatus Electrothrix sp. ATG2]|nr:hypothetical protein [Candidatus Electrothrix sp. ATG2]